ncbi:MAG: hypothetical protein ACLTDR_15130 [Adlercreutzia equolifaciens]
MNLDRVLDLFLEMVPSRAPSWHEAPMAAYRAEKLAEMGFAVTFDASAARNGVGYGQPHRAFARRRCRAHRVLGASGHGEALRGHRGGHRAAPYLRRHYAGRMAEVACSAGETILSADDKAGIAAIFEGLRSVLESGTPRPDITVLLTTCEEQSLLGAGALAEGALAWPENLPAATPEAERDGRFPPFVLDADGASGTHHHGRALLH